MSCLDPSCQMPVARFTVFLNVHGTWRCSIQRELRNRDTSGAGPNRSAGLSVHEIEEYSIFSAGNLCRTSRDALVEGLVGTANSHSRTNHPAPFLIPCFSREGNAMPCPMTATASP